MRVRTLINACSPLSPLPAASLVPKCNDSSHHHFPSAPQLLPLPIIFTSRRVPLIHPPLPPLCRPASLLLSRPLQPAIPHLHRRSRRRLFLLHIFLPAASAAVRKPLRSVVCRVAANCRAVRASCAVVQAVCHASTATAIDCNSSKIFAAALRPLFLTNRPLC